MELGNELRRFRFAHGEISQQQLANAIGVTRLTIHSIETGKFVPSTLISLKLARYFGVRVEDLFYLADENGKNGPREMSRESDGDA